MELELSDLVLRALAAAFAFVAASDGNVDGSELSRFRSLLEDPEALGSSWPYRHSPARRVPFSHAQRHVVDSELFAWITRFEQDFEGARQAALECLGRAAAAHPERVPLMVRVAQVAVVADGDVEGREEVALGQVVHALGLPEDDH